MKRAKRRPLYINPWRPVGYYKNRPRLLGKIAAAGLGHMESVRFIASKIDPFGVRYLSDLHVKIGRVEMNDSWMARP